MKKNILSICILVAMVSYASAQGGAAKRKAEISMGLKQEVKLTDSEIESVLTIEHEFRPKMKVIKDDSALSETDKKVKMDAIRQEKKKKMELTFGKETALRIETFYSGLKKKSSGKSENE